MGGIGTGWGGGGVDPGQDRELVAGCKVWASRRDRKGERKTGFSEVNQLWGPNPLRKSQRSTPKRVGFKRETWRTSHA